MRLRAGLQEYLFLGGKLSFRTYVQLAAFTLLVHLTACGRSSEAVATPTPASAVLSATTLSFSATVIGTTTAASVVTLSNAGAQPLDLTSYSLSDTTNFILATTCSSTLSPGANCAFSIQFRPQEAGSFNATLKLNDNGGPEGGAQQLVSLTGSGTAAPVPQAVVQPPTLAFPQTAAGASSTAQTVTLQNSGAAALTIRSVILSDIQNFTFTTTCGATLGPTASCTVSVLFQPQSIGTFAATLTITDNSGGLNGAQQATALSGNGIMPPSPQAILAPSSLSFPQTVTAATSAAQTATITNAGTAALILSGALLSDTGNFGLTTTCGATLVPAGSCSYSVLFHPQAAGAFSATLTLTDNSGLLSGSQQSLALTGVALPLPVPQAVLSSSGLSFPQTITNSASPAQTITLSNPGNGPLSISDIAITGASATAFSLASGGCGASLAAGASCTENVSYDPKLASASDTASLVFTDNAGNASSTSQTAALQGSALAEVDAVENFGDSITCGFYAQPADGTNNVYSNEGYAGLFDTYVGAPAQNWCRQGDAAADLSRVWAPFFSTPAANGNQLFTLMIGANDAYRYGIGSQYLNNYVEELGAALAWLALPSSDKVLANSITQRTGTWTADTGFNLDDFGLNSSDPNASLTFQVNQPAAGHNLYVVYHVYSLPSSQAGMASISVDGAIQATVDESANSGYAPAITQNSTADSYWLQVIPLGAAGAHTVTFAAVGSPGSTVSMLWAGVPQNTYNTVDGAPRVLVGAITNSPSGNQTYAASVYNIQVRNLVRNLAADGMNITVVPTDTALDPSTDFADLLHPNNSGHTKLAAVFERYR